MLQTGTVESVVSFHVLEFPEGARWHGFQHFARLQLRAGRIPGARFAKVMGCGRGRVFSVQPDWSRYAFLFHWDTPEDGRHFFESAQWQKLSQKAIVQRHWALLPLHSKGLWDGKPRFVPEDAPSGTEASGKTIAEPMAVITRADLKPWRLRSFGKAARAATDALARYPGVQYTLGMGELPFVRQATFSVWDTPRDMKTYAYVDTDHKAAMQGKKKEGWYGEEMYARFRVLKSSEGLATELLADDSF